MPALHVAHTGIWEGKGRPEAVGEQQHPATASPQPCLCRCFSCSPLPLTPNPKGSTATANCREHHIVGSASEEPMG